MIDMIHCLRKVAQGRLARLFLFAIVPMAELGVLSNDAMASSEMSCDSTLFTSHTLNRRGLAVGEVIAIASVDRNVNPPKRNLVLTKLYVADASRRLFSVSLGNGMRTVELSFLYTSLPKTPVIRLSPQGGNIHVVAIREWTDAKNQPTRTYVGTYDHRSFFEISESFNELIEALLMNHKTELMN